VRAGALAWLNGLRPGPEIKRLAIARRGAPSALKDGRVGQVVVAQSQSGDTQYYVVLEDGIADITPVQADIVLNDPDTAAAYPGTQPTPVRRADLVSAKRSATRLLPAAGPAQPPMRTPQIAEAGNDGALCATYANATDPPQISVDVRLADTGPASQPVRRASAGSLADRVVVPPGVGVLVQSRTSPDATGGTLSVVTDLGVSYPLVSGDVRGYLGYEGVAPLPMPAGLVALLPTGRALDPAAASVPVTND
jgi:hypothetical protein